MGFFCKKGVGGEKKHLSSCRNQSTDLQCQSGLPFPSEISGFINTISAAYHVWVEKVEVLFKVQ